MELFKLLGKIAVDNAEAKKALKETSQEGQETESKLGKAFGALGSGAAAAGKAIAAGLAAGATACVGLATAAINSYGDYEQLVGGVETLFGTKGAKSIEEYADMVGKSVADVKEEFNMLQESQTLVMENAAQAYKTAGLSVNEYMESVNGIAAALNQSTGSQIESARLADQAIIDMSDNAAKMGTSMEAIQNAYAGFSKQNYTMLDNLKLGYGGTKEEMQRLLDDASKISGIKYDISSFSDVTQAIHVMQEEMGIAGTTAKEAAGTIQGSFGMLKGAWSNLLTGLSDPEADLQSLINNVFESVTTFAGNLVPRITQVFSGIATAFQQLVPMITGEIPNLLNQVLPAVIDGAVALVNGLVSALPSVIDTLMTALPMLIEGFMTIVDALVGALPQIIEAIVGALPTLIPQLIDAVVSLIMMLVEMLPQIITPIIDALPTIIVAITDALISNLPTLISGVGQLIVALAAAIPQVLGALWEAIKGIFTMLGGKILGFFEPVKQAISNAWAAMGNVPGLAQMKNHIETVWGAIKSHVSTVINAVKDVVTTVWDAIKNNISTVINAVKNIISTAWEAIKTIISNAMKLIASVLQGDWEGVKSAISNILNAIKSVISSIWDGIKSVISSSLNGIKNIVSSIWNGIKSVISSTLNTIKKIVSSAWNNIKSAISKVLKNVVKVVKDGAKDMLGAGKDLVKGIWEGISKSYEWIKGKITGWVGNVTNFIKKLFGIKSPSTVMRDEVGRELVRGVAVGIEQNTSEATDAVKNLGEEVIKQAKASLAGEYSDAEVLFDKLLGGGKIDKEVASKINGEIIKLAKDRLATYKKTNKMTAESESQFWDMIRQQIAEGTEERIEADELYFEARSSIDQELIDAAKEKLENYQVYNDMTLVEEAGFWDELRQKYEEGTDARIEADKNYLAAKKSINEKILSSEETLQDELDGIAQRIPDRQKEILDKFGLFDKFDANDDQFDPATQMLLNMDADIRTMQKYKDLMDGLEGRIGGTALFDELKSMGIDARGNILEVSKMTDAELAEFVRLYDEKAALAKSMAEEDLAPQMMEDSQKAFDDFVASCGEVGVEVTTTLADYMATAEGTVLKSLETIAAAFSTFQLGTPNMDVSSLFSAPTISNGATVYSLKTSTVGGGEGGSQKATTGTLSDVFASIVEQKNMMAKLIEMLGKFFPELKEAFNVNLFIDGRQLAAEIAPNINAELGSIQEATERGVY